jgi:predicted RNase H-like nuclease (RuvC/YqgF family)
MEPNYSKIFNEKIMQTLSAYCLENEIKDIDNFIFKCFKQGFDIKKYGLLGETLNEGEKHLKTDVIGEKEIIKEIIVEKRVEIPVEVIKEVEKIVEVPIEVIKEVEKIVTIYDKSGENELGEKIAELKEEMSKKDKELDELRHNLDIKLDNTNEKMLQETLQKLRKEISEKNEIIKELTKINQDLQNTKQNKLNTVFLKGSNLNDTI